MPTLSALSPKVPRHPSQPQKLFPLYRQNFLDITTPTLFFCTGVCVCECRPQMSYIDVVYHRDGCFFWKKKEVSQVEMKVSLLLSSLAFDSEARLIPGKLIALQMIRGSKTRFRYIFSACFLKRFPANISICSLESFVNGVHLSLKAPQGGKGGLLAYPLSFFHVT